MTRRRIEPYMRVAARIRERHTLERLPASPNPTGFEVKGRYYRGPLCELIFEDWLDEFDVEYETLSNTRGVSDPGADFRVAAQAGRAVPRSFLIDVKSVPVHSYDLFINAEEFQRRPRADYYVAVQPHAAEQEATIHGYLTGDQVAVLPVDPGRRGSPNHAAPLTSLRSIESALAIWR